MWFYFNQGSSQMGWLGLFLYSLFLFGKGAQVLRKLVSELHGPNFNYICFPASTLEKALYTKSQSDSVWLIDHKNCFIQKLSEASLLSAVVSHAFLSLFSVAVVHEFCGRVILMTLIKHEKTVTSVSCVCEHYCTRPLWTGNGGNYVMATQFGFSFL